MELSTAPGPRKAPLDRLLDRMVSVAFWTLSVVCLLGLNDFAHMLTGVERVFSPLLLVCCVVALAELLRVRLTVALGTSGVLILSALVSYAGIGIVVSIVTGSDVRSDAVFHLARHVNSVLLIVATALGGRVVWARIGGEGLLRGLLVVMAASCVLMLAHPWLMEAYVLLPQDGAVRFSGSFSNPNNAGLVACLTVALALAFVCAGRFRPFADGVLLAAGAALVLTLSRTALVVLPALLAHSLLASRGIERRRLAGVLALAGVVVAGSFTSLTGALQNSQLARLESLVQIVDSRSIDDVSLAGRLTLWRAAADMALEAPLFGHGLGRLHQLDTGLYDEDGNPQGAHNQYLVLVGESGFIPLVLFMAFLWTMARLGPRRQALLGAVSGWALVLGVFSVTAHGILTNRPCNFLIGVACVALATEVREKRRPSLQRSPPTPLHQCLRRV